MKLLSLTVENILGCREAHLDLRPRSVHIIGGLNYQGKSSFLIALQMAIGGKRLFPEAPITDGEDEARVVVELEPEDGDEDLGFQWPCRVVRSLVRDADNPKDYDTSVEIIENDVDPLDANTAPAPQTLLNKLVGDGMAFDPLKFTQASANEQANILRGLVGIDFSKLDAEYDKLFERRKKIKAQGAVYDGQIKGMELPDNMPSERIDVSALTTRLKAAVDYNAELEASKTALEKHVTKMTTIDETIKGLQDQIDQLCKERTEVAKSHEFIADKIEGAEPFDTADIEAELLDAGRVNTLFEKQEQNLELRELRREKSSEANALTKQLAAINLKKNKMIADANWPVDGLGFDKTGVTYNGTPFSSLSSAEQLRISVGIQLHKNGQFRLAIIHDGSLLDQGSLVDVAKIVSGMDGDCIVEIVTHPDRPTVVDGVPSIVPGTDRECHLVFKHGKGESPDGDEENTES